ncbi:MAG: 50S ribosomal protein L23 [Candidatus Dormibacteria bacterium]
MKSPSEVVIRPMISEKSYAQMQQNKYVFRVRRDANKIEIKAAIEEAFKVEVLSVNTLSVKGKLRTLRRGIAGRTSNWKKAIVTVKAGQKIDRLFEGV